MMKRATLLLFCAISCQLSVGIAYAAIQYGGQSYEASFAASTTDQVAGVVASSTGGVDLNNLTSPQSISAGLGIWGNIKEFFINVDAWLREHAGIDFFGILQAIGHWLMLTLQWIVNALKIVLNR